MFELYRTSLIGIGNASEVWIDKDANLCKKYYRTDSIVANGNTTKYQSMETLTKFFNNEVQWSTTLQSPNVLKLYEYGELSNDAGYYILQEYIGPDLLTVYMAGQLHTLYPDIIEQVEHMFAILQEHDIYKLNNALSNMVGANGKIKMFDFKYTQLRILENQEKEKYSITEWLTKIDPLIVDRLVKYI